MFLKFCLNILKNGKILMPSVHTRVSRCYAASDRANDSANNNNCDDKKPANVDKLGLNKDLEKAINNQINRELGGALANLAMAEYYERKAVGLPGFAKSHNCHAKKEYCHAKELIAILGQRGGNLSLKAVEPPKTQDWKGPLEVAKFAVEAEKSTAIGLCQLLSLAGKVQDRHVSNVLGSSLMGEKIEIIADFEKRLGKLQECSSPECLSSIDNSLLNAKK